MKNLNQETVLSVHHWTDKLFSFTTTRSATLRFKSGQFVMLGIEVDGKPLMRAYSIASAHYEDHLEFYSIKVPDGPLTSRLQHLQVGDSVLVSTKPTGTLVTDNLLPGRHLYLLSTGTGIAPFLSLIKDPEIYENFEHVILTHGCRYIAELAYDSMITQELPKNPYFGDCVAQQLHYYPAITRDAFHNQGRLTALLGSNRISNAVNLPDINPEDDRFMICGSSAMLQDLSTLLDERGFKASPRMGEPGHYAIEKAFVDT